MRFFIFVAPIQLLFYAYGGQIIFKGFGNCAKCTNGNRGGGVLSIKATYFSCQVFIFCDLFQLFLLSLCPGMTRAPRRRQDGAASPLAGSKPIQSRGKNCAEGRHIIRFIGPGSGWRRWQTLVLNPMSLPSQHESLQFCLAQQIQADPLGLPLVRE